jgi:hypothetical protein
MRAATLGRLVVGATCLAAPRQVLGVIGGPDRGEDLPVGLTRVLGARLLLQGGGDLLAGSRLRRVGILIELTHATSMLPVATRWPEHRRNALVSAGVATTLAVLDLGQA